MTTPNPYSTFDDNLVAAHAPVDARVRFLQRTYSLLFAGILVFATTLFLTSIDGPVRGLAASLAGIHPLLYMAVFIGGAIAVHALAEKPGIGVFAFFGFAFLFGLLSAPLILMISSAQPQVIPQAAIITGVTFVGLTAYVFKSGKDFSFLRGILWPLVFGLIGLALAGWAFGFAIGIWYSYLAVAVFAGFILYDTSNILNRYPTTAYVSAAMVLFVDVIILFKHIALILFNRE